nr:hypothetical protein [Candidatus Baldrarchaeota archaeon]
MNKGIIIVLSGIDGSGKSTISRKLSKSLIKNFNLKTRIVWVKSLHTLAYLIYVLFRKMWGIEYIVNPKGKITEHYTTKWMKKLGSLWGFIEFLSVLPWILITLLYRFLGFTVICDRFIMDFLATVSLRVNNPFWPWKSIWGKSLKALQRKFLTFHLKVTLKTALQRRLDIEYDLKEFKLLTALYRILTNDTNAHEILNEKTSISNIIKSIKKNLTNKTN